MKPLCFLLLFACTALAAIPKGGPKVETDRGTVGFLHYHLLSGGDIRYPDDAAKQKLQGSGFFLMRLRADGSVQSLTVRSSTGYPLLDKSVTQTLEKYRFRPNTKAPLLWLVGFIQPSTVIIKVSLLKEADPPPRHPKQ